MVMVFNSRAQNCRLMLVFLAFVSAVSTVLFSEQAFSQQQVFVDFDSETDAGEHVYTAAERIQILDRMIDDYSRFNFSFTDVQPVAGDFSTVTVNDGPAFGIAEQIDPRNLDKNDTATIDVNSGATTSSEFVTLTANVASHELGHLLGLRHFDSFGPIGSGLDPNTATAGSFTPDYTGPNSADDTRFHIMESDQLFIEDDFNQFFSERSAIKLTFNEQGTVISEDGSIKDSISTAQMIELDSMIVPNTIEVGDRAGLGDFDVDAVTVLGTLGINGLSDFYQFSAAEGDLLNFELMSDSLRNNPNVFDTTLRVLDSNGADIDYFGQSAAFNDDELESFDSILIDFLLPSDGDYFVQVSGFNNAVGDYELFATRFNGVIVAIPEPGTGACVLFAGIAFGSSRRRRLI